MSVQFPTRTPAADAQPGSPAPQPTFPIYSPDPNRNEAPQRPTLDPTKENPLGDFHKVAQNEPGNERELLFTIGGKPLYAPRDEDIPLNLPFKMMRDMRKYGLQVAGINAMAALLGDEALDLLADAPTDISPEDWAKIMDVLTEKVFSKIKDMHQPGKD